MSEPIRDHRAPGEQSANGQRRRVYVATIGDANSAATHSGAPFFLVRSGRSAGVVDEGLALGFGRVSWAVRRVAWNLKEIAQGHGRGGFQYSNEFLEDLWRADRHRMRGATTINCFQLYPRSIASDPAIRKGFFVDMTLRQLFEEYAPHTSIRVGKYVAADAIKREREGYQAAAVILAKSRWAARSFAAEYGIAPEAVHVVLQGANLDPAGYQWWLANAAHTQGSARAAEDGQVLRIAYVGKAAEWRRKGLDTLIEALRWMRGCGSRATLRVIGTRSNDVPRALRCSEGIEWLGPIDKRSDARRYMSLVAECDVGCLPSRVEAAGLVLREFHALGLAAVTCDVGGAPEQIVGGAGVVLPRQIDSAGLGAALLSLERDPDRLAEMRSTAWRRREETSWANTILQIKGILERFPV